jgi:hypothetical protein
MKCHWAVEGDKKYWIPGCWSSVVHPEVDGCCPCRKERKNKRVENPDKQVERDNKYLLKENARLNRLIEKLTKK